MCSPQMIAVDPDHSGSASRHAMFSVFHQRTGRLVSPLTLFAAGPRHAGQFSACGMATEQSTSISMNKNALHANDPRTLQAQALARGVRVPLSTPELKFGPTLRSDTASTPFG